MRRALVDAVVLAGVKVLPKVEPFSLVLADEEVNVGLRDKVLHLSLESHVVRISILQVHQVHSRWH